MSTNRLASQLHLPRGGDDQVAESTAVTKNFKMKDDQFQW